MSSGRTSSRMDGLIILDSGGKAIVQTNFRNLPVSYPLLHIEAFNSALARATQSSSSSSRAPDLDPVLWVAGPIGGGSACCHVEHGGLVFLCPVSEEVDPLFVFAFLDTFLSVLKEYLGEISAASLRDNFDVIYQLLEEMLDDGYPLTTEPNALRDIVLPPSLLTKLLSVTGAQGLATASPTPFASPIPWRKSGVRYNNNEIYFDIVEELDAIVGRNGAVVSSEIWGKIKCQCKLSGTPDLLLSFSQPRLIDDASFHPCIRYQKWTRDRILSFVPPDGHFVLMDYSVPPPALGMHQVPVQLKPHIVLGEKSGSFEITITSRSQRQLDDVVIVFSLGNGATGAVASSVAHGVGPSEKNRPSSWAYEPNSKALTWTLPALAPSSSHTLKGSFTSSESHPRPSSSLLLTFHMATNTLSGLKVDSLKLTGPEVYKPFKGVRGSVVGKVDWRW